MSENKDGFVRVTLSSFDRPINGRVYPAEVLKDAIQRRLAKGPVYLEYGQPKLPDSTIEGRNLRLMSTDESRVAGKIESVDFTATECIAQVTPLGPFKAVLEVPPTEFSIRFAARYTATPDGKLKDIIAWDLVSAKE